MSTHIANPSRTQAIMAAHGFHPKKHLGQNFLTDTKILTRIVDAAGVDATTDVIEIGPGIGALTEFLAASARRVVALEIDPQLIPVLAETLAAPDSVTVVNADVLKVDLPALMAAQFGAGQPAKVVANLPYYITTPILLHLLNSPAPLTQLTVMMQKEVADRLAAGPGSKDYGSLSIAVQQRMQVTTAFTVSRKSFVPAPNVDSAIVNLTRRSAPLVAVRDQAGFDRLVRGAFAARRKTLWNNLINLYGKDAETKAKLTAALAAAAITPSTRGEALSIAEFGRLSDALGAQGVAVSPKS